MPRTKTPVSPKQKAVIEEYHRRGCSAERIADLHLEALDGFGHHIIKEVLREAGLLNLNRSRRLTGIRHVTPERETEIAACIRNDGGKLVDREIAVMFGISRHVASRIRTKAIGKVGRAGTRRTAEMKKISHDKLVRHFATGRKKLFIKLLCLREKLATKPEAIPKTCRVCERRWFKTPDFYRMTKSPAKCRGICRPCFAEIKRLRSLGIPNEESQRFAAAFSWLPPETDAEVLFDRFRNDLQAYHHDPLRQCAKCRQIWYGNTNYFHVIRDETDTPLLLDICLRCAV
jgi:hypothetical protein